MTGIALTGPIQYPYTAIDLTAEIEKIPNMYGRLQELDLMPIRSERSVMVEIQMKDGLLTILAAEERGAPGSVGDTPDERGLILKVPHFPHFETIKAEDLQDRFVFGSGRQQRRSVETATSERLVALRRKHAITLEFLRMGALKGRIFDGRNRELYNLFSVFGITEKVVYFDLANVASKIGEKCEEVIAHVEENLLGDVMNGVHALVSQEFFDAFVSHPNVEKFYVNHAAAVALSGQRVTSFPFRGVTFEVYRAQAPDMTGTGRRFIAAGEGHAFPLGTQQTFQTSVAPPDHVDMVNMEAPEIFVSPEILRHGTGVELKSQSNVLPLCKRPEVLVRLDDGADPG